MTQIIPAQTYQSCSDLWVLTTYFNPAHESRRLENYRSFAESLNRSGIPLFTVECAFRHDDFELAPTSNVMQVRSRDILWQKERLLNHAVSHLSTDIRKIAWIDGDVLFSNPAWAVETSSLLDEYPVVQLWEYAVRLPQDILAYSGKGEKLKSMAAVLTRDPTRLRNGGMDVHGFTGFAWAARRDVLDCCGLYGTGFELGNDHLMAHAFWEDFESSCMREVMGVGLMQSNPLRHNTSPMLSRVRAVMPESAKKYLAVWRYLRKDNDRFQEHFLNWGHCIAARVQGRWGTPRGQFCIYGTV